MSAFCPMSDTTLSPHPVRHLLSCIPQGLASSLSADIQLQQGLSLSVSGLWALVHAYPLLNPLTHPTQPPGFSFNSFFSENPTLTP
jgi:hypothetical protein